MKTSLIFLSIIIATNCHAETKKSHPHLKMNPQTAIVFKDHEVPHFVILEKNSKKQIVIDRHPKTIKDTKFK